MTKLACIALNLATTVVFVMCEASVLTASSTSPSELWGGSAFIVFLYFTALALPWATRS